MQKGQRIKEIEIHRYYYFVYFNEDLQSFQPNSKQTLV